MTPVSSKDKFTKYRADLQDSSDRKMQKTAEKITQQLETATAENMHRMKFAQEQYESGEMSQWEAELIIQENQEKIWEEETYAEKLAKRELKDAEESQRKKEISDLESCGYTREEAERQVGGSSSSEDGCFIM